MLGRIIRAVLAVAFLLVGVYWLLGYSGAWVDSRFQIFSTGEKGKDVFSAVLFGVIFIGYGVWEIYRLLTNPVRK